MGGPSRNLDDLGSTGPAARRDFSAPKTPWPLFRVLAPLAGDQESRALALAGAAWSAAFGLFAILYGRVLASPRAEGGTAKPI